MIDITHKSSTLRTAIASATVTVGDPDTIAAVRNKTVPKGDVLEAARVAALFAVKRTSDMIPDCHPIPVEYAQVSFEVAGMEIRIETEVHTVYKTGVEVEAMHGASVAALTIYDMLKPIDKQIEISRIRLVEKKGGKSDYRDTFKREIVAAVLVCSDSVHAGKKEDQAGKVIISKLKSMGVQAPYYDIIPDDSERIRNKVLELHASGPDLILITGGTGLSARDTTPEAVMPLIEREIPGMMEAARGYGQQRTPYAMLSRGVAGLRGKTLIITLPGSTRGATETMDALFPSALHVFRILEGARHQS
jgi:molybdenum cofactor biosynthesis protein MoaC